MQTPSSRQPFGQDARLAALSEYDILDTAAEPAFDDVVFIASQACDTPVALVSLVERDRQWFKARVGLEACDTPIGQSVCALALGQHDLLVIPDLAGDPRTSSNSLVTGDPGLRFYAGAPLVTPAGVVIGTVCVLDTASRPEGLTAAQARILEALARQVIAQLELRRLLRRRDAEVIKQRRSGDASLARAAASEEENATLRDREARSRAAQEAGRIGTFEWEVATGLMIVSAELCRLFGLPVAPSYPASNLEALVLREDAGIRSDPASRQGGSAEPDVEYRIRRADDGRLRWIARRAEFVRDASGEVARMFGTVRDVTDRKRLQVQQAALLELGDRLREAATASEVAGIAGEVLGRTLTLCRAGYARIEARDGKLTIEQDWTAPGVSTLKGQHLLSTFQVTLDRLSRGEAVAIEDVASAAWLRGGRESYAGIGVRAVIEAPLIDKDELVGLLYAHQAEPRHWNKDEVDFVSGVADRTQAALAKLRAEAEQRVLNHELSHRLKNTLAMVQAIARQTLRPVADRVPVEALERRIHALGTAHDVLLQRSWSTARIGTVVAAVLGTIEQPGRFRVSGPEFDLGPRGTLSLSLLLHELATNALKYGALSNEAGQVSVTWRLDGAGKDANVVLDWAETGGPAVREPERQGFGSRLIRMGMVGTGGVELRYLPAGLRAEMRASLVQMQQA